MRIFNYSRVFLVIFLMLILSGHYLATRTIWVYAQPSWPSSWIEIDQDRNENGAGDDWRDVEYAYYQYDSSYLYLKLKCFDLPGKYWTNHKDGRYKWFIDLEGNMYFSGGNVYDAEYLLFVEDTDYDGVGEIYLVSDTNNDNNFGEYEPWPPSSHANYEITDTDIGGFRIVPPYQIEMYINWDSIGNPSSYWLMWSTDQQNPNLDQSPCSDRIDEEQPIAVHNVAGISQTPTPTVVKQGEHVTIHVVVENKGTQAETFNVTCYFNTTALATQLVTNLDAGHQATVTFDWDTTGIPSGTYSIKAWADSSAEITETDETDNWCTSPATVEIEQAPFHDVATIAQVPDKWTVVQGETVNINVTVKNLGDYSETFNVTCYYDNNPISYQTVTNLPQKNQTSLTFVWSTIGVPAGMYYIRAMADSNHAIAEVDENNNNCTTLETVAVCAGELGELFVDKVKTAVISGEDPPVVGFSTVYELTIIIVNTGGSDVSNIEVNETISSDVTFVSAGIPSQGSIVMLPPPKIIWSVGTLNPGKNATLTFRIRVTPTTLGQIYVNHKEDAIATGIDVPSGTPLSDTCDNNITVTPIIRDVAAISQTPSSTVICQGDTAAIYVTVKNTGNISLTFDVACYYDSTLIGVMRVYNLEASAQTTISFAWDTTSVLPGTYSIVAEADSSYEISESDETNNVCTSPSTVKIVIHDIAILGQTPSPTVVVQGEIVTISVVVKNEGTEPETFTVSCYYNDTLLETKTITNLPSSTTQTLSFLWNTSEVPPATYFINTQASVIPGEKDTSDNACRSTNLVTVNPITPPLSVSIDPVSASIYVGQSVTFTSTPDGGTPPYSYQWYLDNNPVSGATSSSWTFTSTTIGIYYVHLNVTDSKGATAKSEVARIEVLSAPSPVGGYSISLTEQTPIFHISTYIALIALFGAAMSIVKSNRKTEK
ncbi:MAG: PKD domain-containing protein [Candidatus Bathyarchaeota archaeon]|nr:PKD domain-containing protein [Candidatus Bathyarchaeota archaeon]